VRFRLFVFLAVIVAGGSLVPTSESQKPQRPLPVSAAVSLKDGLRIDDDLAIGCDSLRLGQKARNDRKLE
jgi:hypothetical protein